MPKTTKPKRSAKTWLKEFYPVKARDVSKEKALEHSIQKWRGLLKSNRCKHKVDVGNHGAVVDGNGNPVLDIDSETCALCQHHFNDNNHCGVCPLAKALGMPCYTSNDETKSPMDEWINCEDPKPMLRALRRARKFDG